MKSHLERFLKDRVCLMCKHYSRPCVAGMYAKSRDLPDDYKRVHSDFALCTKLDQIEPFNMNAYLYASASPKDAVKCGTKNFEAGGLNAEYLEYLKKK